MKRPALLVVLVLTLALHAAAAAQQPDEGPSSGDRKVSDGTSNTLVGSWVATVTPDPSLGIPPFRDLFTFHSDGTMTMIDDNAPAPPFPFTPGHGVWKKNPGGDYTFRYLNLMFDPASFASTGTTSVTNRVKLSDGGDGFTATGHLKVFDKDNNLLFEADGTVVAQRITIDEP